MTSDDGGPFRYCHLPTTPEPIFADVHDENRLRAIVATANKWVSGTILHYCFFDEDSDGTEIVMRDGTTRWATWRAADEGQEETVRAAMRAWLDVGLGIEFREVAQRTEAEIRIGFMQGDGSWSYLGTDNLQIGTNARTMNFGWPLVGASGRDTALHEVGHALGFPHEHQNPFAGIVWDEEAVYEELAKPPNSWPRSRVYHNILRKLDEVEGTSWDPDSIMHYSFRNGLILEPGEYRSGIRPAPGLSHRDRSWAAHIYPRRTDPSLPTLASGSAALLDVENGDQRDFRLLPSATRHYTLQVLGEGDTVMVMFRVVEGTPRYFAGDNDMGSGRSAQLRVRLYAGEEYLVRVRVAYRAQTAPLAVAMF